MKVKLGLVARGYFTITTLGISEAATLALRARIERRRVATPYDRGSTGALLKETKMKLKKLKPGDRFRMINKDGASSSPLMVLGGKKLIDFVARRAGWIPFCSLKSGTTTIGNGEMEVIIV